ncbi:NAD(P)/FAD-dependent oxidoreductase [Crassaminicella thermophila]|uniref:NAD(P)/FAD-dependent oxidoreductase n=1 Tax=Crassaminicella thermophila TaxID=2599308 RepID=A0A5C0SEP7_CRATE|nr:NAD(P)/FAD-dependent oxidoreductase [Crassaminicella thermophila]QEK12913.1 NAD(P)/FAD-dependent oxidoreductase [Crassaminicella thermophila]
MKQQYDVIIIGSGVVGSAIARELTRYEFKIGVLEKELDVVCETSGRNSGVIHAGFNNKPGSLMAKFCVEGCLGFDKVAKELDIPFKRIGKLVTGFTDEDMEILKKLKEQGDKNGVPGLRIISEEEIKKIDPNVAGKVALYSPMTGIVNPFIYTIALAENAYQNGAVFFFGREVVAIQRKEECYEVTTKNNEKYYAKWLINSAGLNSDQIARMVGITDYTIYPCRGEYFILDQKASAYLKVPAYPVPNKKEGGLGVHLTPTIDGNVLIGPSAEYLDEKDNYAATKEVMDKLVAEGTKILPQIKREHFIRNFSGIRPKLVEKETGGYADFVIEQREEIPNMINLIGIESPGLTSAVPIARYVVEKMKQKEELKENQNFNPIRKGILNFTEQTDERKAELIKENPNYGEIICRCESITKQEILEAIHNPLGVETVTGVKNRTRAMMGRCQGGYCQTRIAELIIQEKQKKVEEVIYSRQQGKMFVGGVR